MITLKAGEVRPFPLTGRFLICRQGQTGFHISAPEQGIPETALATADVAILERVPRINLINRSAVEIQVNIQSSNFKIEPSSDGQVSVGNNVNVQKVIEPIAFTQTVQPANVNAHKPEVVCLPGVTTLLIAAGARKGLRLNIQATEVGGIYLGGNTVANKQGGFLDLGQVEYIDTEGALYAYNPNVSSVVVNILSLERV